MLSKRVIRTITAAFLALVLLFAQTPVASAARVANLSELNQARVSFTFDDGFASTRTLAAPILESRGIDGVLYLTSDVPGSNATLDTNLPAITWDQVRELQNVYGWEIGGHTQTHVEMPTVSSTQNEAELVNSNTAFQAQGLNVTNFASPFGAYDNATLTEILKYYKSHRGFADRDALNTTPYNRAVLMVQDVNEATTVAQVQAWVDQAIAEKRWLILVFHHTATQPEPTYEYTVTTGDLGAMADYVQSRASAGQIDVVTVEEAITIPGTNVIQNSGFEAGLANGWTTDNAAVVAADNNNHGNYGSPVQSVNMTGTATAGHLFSGQTAVNPNTSYVLDAFVNATALTSGELGFYIDEYDANNNWVSGQWLGNVTNGTIGFFTRLYNTTSNLVNSVRIQTYLTAGATGNAYVDSVNLYNTDGAAPTGTVTPSPTGAPVPTATPSASGNIVNNGSFDQGMTSWTTDNPANVTIQANAVRLNGNATAAHLFQTLNGLDNTATYAFKVDANAANLISGELGFYIDEYNASGTWLSGQWLGAAINGAASTFERAYKATSNLVSSIRVQTYLTPGATGNATVDNFSLTNQNAVQPTVAPTATPSAAPTGIPTITPAPTATPAATSNLVQNGSFETLLNGFAQAWETTVGFTIDTISKGNSGTNSLHIPANVAYAHAFSQRITVTPGASYTWSQYVSTLTGAGEFGFYIDEYDAAGNWISGQWKGMISGPSTGIRTFQYTPSSANVSSVRLQYYVTPNSTFNMYIDSVSLSN